MIRLRGLSGLKKGCISGYSIRRRRRARKRAGAYVISGCSRLATWRKYADSGQDGEFDFRLCKA